MKEYPFVSAMVAGILCGFFGTPLPPNLRPNNRPSTTIVKEKKSVNNIQKKPAVQVNFDARSNKYYAEVDGKRLETARRRDLVRRLKGKGLEVNLSTAG